MSYFEKRASFELAQRITGIGNPGVLRKIHELSFGHPYYIYLICERMNELGETSAIGVKDVF